MPINFIPDHDAPDNAPHRRNVNQNNLAVFTVDRIMVLRWHDQKESFLEKEECWWHTHDNLDIGSEERL